MSGPLYLGAGALAFIALAGVQILAWAQLLHRQLRSEDLEVRRRGLRRWFRFVLALQLAVLILSAAYLAVLRGIPGRDWAAIAPAVGAIVGTALPLQLAVSSITRAARA